MIKVAAVAILEQSCKDAGSARHADRGGIVMVFKEHPLSREPVEMRCLHVLVSIAAEGIRRLIIGEEKNKVRALLSS